MQTATINNADNPSTQGVYLNVPMSDWSLLKELIRKLQLCHIMKLVQM